MKNDDFQEKQVFKLSTGEKVNNAEIEKLIENTCHYVKFVTLSDGENENHVALIFPNIELLNNPSYKLTPDEGCFCPRNLTELGRCLSGCMNNVNKQLEPGSGTIISTRILNEDKNKAESYQTPENINKTLKTFLKDLIDDVDTSENETYYIPSL